MKHKFSKTHFLIIIVLFIFPLLQSCGQINKMTGVTELKETKQKLQNENQELKQELNECERNNKRQKNKISQLNATKEKLESNLSSLKKEKESLLNKVKKLNEQVNTYKQTEKSGVRVSFFNGEIIYNILAQAYSDYRVALRYKGLVDSDFSKQRELFNQGKGGDKAVLNVMKKMDKNNDQIIKPSEAKSYRKEIEDEM